MAHFQNRHFRRLSTKSHNNGFLKLFTEFQVKFSIYIGQINPLSSKPLSLIYEVTQKHSRALPTDLSNQAGKCYVWQKRGMTVK